MDPGFTEMKLLDRRQKRQMLSNQGLDFRLLRRTRGAA
jgi:hypothetical protein